MKQQVKHQILFSQRPLNLLQRITSRRNAIWLLRLFMTLVVILALYSITFQYLMHLEGQEHSHISGLYWIISTMTTVGLGDITFHSDAGKLFTVFVICTGILFLLILLPFTIFQLFQSSARIPRELPESTRGHVVLTEYGPLTSALVERLKRYNQTYVVLVSDLEVAMQLQDQGIKTVAGEFDDPNTFKEIRIHNAAFLVSTGSDIANTSLAYTVRQVSKDIPIIATASSGTARHILEKAGCTHVLALDEMMGQSLARRIIAGDSMAHVIGQIDELIIAEAAAAGTPLVGKTIESIQSSHLIDAAIVGVWEGGTFSFPSGSMNITAKNVLILAGTQKQIDRYNELFCIYNINSAPIIIIGGGSVGQALGYAMRERDLDFRIIEKSKNLVHDNKQYIHGDATDLEVMKKAGYFEAPAVAITSHSDQVNIYLTTHCRHLRKDIQIISRATLDRNIHTLKAAGCDFVISHASLGANNIFSLSKRGNILMISEGVDVFRVKTPKVMIGKTVRHATIREKCGCEVVGVRADGAMMISPYADILLSANEELILIGTVESEEKFFQLYRPEK
jgi:Trk K+ transport system NAD-binding subunit